MKKILVFTLGILTATFAFAQTMQIIYNGNTLPNTATINVTGFPTDQFVIHLYIKNTSNVVKEVKFKKIEKVLVQDSENSFCFAGQCYDPTIYISPTFVTVQPNEIDTTCKPEYNSNGRSGTSQIVYVFFDKNNINDSVSVTVNYTTSTSIETQNRLQTEYIKAFPNPCNSTVTFGYKVKPQAVSSQIVISNIIGEKLETINLYNKNDLEKEINISHLQSGIYFYSLISDGKILETHKLVKNNP